MSAKFSAIEFVGKLDLLRRIVSLNEFKHSALKQFDSNLLQNTKIDKFSAGAWPQPPLGVNQNKTFFVPPAAVAARSLRGPLVRHPFVT